MKRLTCTLILILATTSHAIAADKFPPEGWPPVVPVPDLRTDINESELQRDLEVVGTCQGHFQAQTNLTVMALADLDKFRAETPDLKAEDHAMLHKLQAALIITHAASRKLSTQFGNVRTKTGKSFLSLDLTRPQQNYEAAKAMWVQFHHLRGGAMSALASFDGSNGTCELSITSLELALSLD